MSDPLADIIYDTAERVLGDASGLYTLSDDAADAIRAAMVDGTLDPICLGMAHVITRHSTDGDHRGYYWIPPE
jgi:hypothetical protein